MLRLSLLFSIMVSGGFLALSQDKPGCAFYYDKEFAKKVYTRGTVEPEFTGGAVAYMRFLNKHLRVPDGIIEESGSIPIVRMEFVVDEKGLLHSIVLNDNKDSASFEPMEKEVFRLLRLMPAWEPGSCQNKKVPMKVKRVFMICIKLEYE